MNARNTSSDPRTQVRGTGADGHWWKAWVLLTSVGATVLGWMAFPPHEQPQAGGISSLVSMSVENAPAFRVDPIDRPSQQPRVARALPTMPQKPVFQAPVTRTRRS